MSDMVEVVIDSIRVSLMSQQRIVILREADAERYLAIWIGPYEAEAITIALQDVEVQRPLTHDLLRNVFQALNARILRVEVTTLRNDVYFGNIVAEVNGYNLDIDARVLWMRLKRLQGSHFASLRQCQEVVNLLGMGRLDPLLAKTWSFPEIGPAHQVMMDNASPPGNMAALINAPEPGLKRLPV